MKPNPLTEPELSEVIWREYERQKAALPPMDAKDYDKAVQGIAEALGL